MPTRVRYEGVGGGPDLVHVLILGGWSPGPLTYLQSRFRQDCVFFEPTLPMPPVGCAWLCMWETVLLWLCGVVAWSLATDAQGWISSFVSSEFQLPILIFLTFFLPVLIILVVRGAVRRSVAKATAAIDAHAIDVVVGFSWGGAIASFLLAKGCWHGPTLLLAPTLTAVANAARLPRPTPFFRAKSSSSASSTNDADTPIVSIFHATDDAFCPRSQIAELEQTGASCVTLRDAHPFVERESEEAIGKAFAALLERVCVNGVRL